MIRTIEIKNYKSIDQLTLELGRVNVFIGENGCGKTNILEAIGLAAAAAANKLDNEFLHNRGIRVTLPKRMRSGFTRESATQAIEVSATSTIDAHLLVFAAILENGKGHFGGWINRAPDYLTVSPDSPHIQRIPSDEVVLNPRAPQHPVRRVEFWKDPYLRRSATEMVLNENAQVLHLDKFLTYTPHEEALRDLARDSWIEPVGIHGEGLFALLQSLDESAFAELKQCLELIHWFDALEIVPGATPTQHSLKIFDQYLADGLAHFDQRSANEGFLFLLLYGCLLVSPHTPKFFAVDNVDTSLNPKLAAGAIRMFTELCRTHDRQVLLTTHNPGTLDGLDLSDDEQRLFVVYRDLEGRTSVHRIQRDGDAKDAVRLSEAFLRGYLGGLPDHF